MNYRISLYETFDSNGVGIINLFVEIDGQIYNSTTHFTENDSHFIKNRTKKEAISGCFKEISRMLEKI